MFSCTERVFPFPLQGAALNISHPLWEFFIFEFRVVFQPFCIYTQQPFDVVAWVSEDKRASISWT